MTIAWKIPVRFEVDLRRDTRHHHALRRQPCGLRPERTGRCRATAERRQGAGRRPKHAVAIRPLRAAPEIRRGVGAHRDAARLASLSALQLGQLPQYGWYYDDKTPWGEIVHHYGRWVYDAQMGWIWTPGSEFSPGWVVWRTSPEWVGWAPMLPDEDVQTISAADFNNAAYWIFVETQKFAQGCNGATRAAVAGPGAAEADHLRHRHQVRRRNHRDRAAVLRRRSVVDHRHRLRAVADLVPRADR